MAKYVGTAKIKGLKRVVIDVTPKEHSEIKSKCADVGLTMKAVTARLLFAWLAGEIKLPEK